MEDMVKVDMDLVEVNPDLFMEKMGLAMEEIDFFVRIIALLIIIFSFLWSKTIFFDILWITTMR